MNEQIKQEAEMPADRYDPSVAGPPRAAEPEEGGGGDAGPAELEEELERSRAAYQRLAADFENYKRRKLQETQELARYGSAALLQALLPALDNLSRAVSHIDPEANDGLSEGLRLTLRQLEEALSSQGVQKVASVGEPFDPRVHDAVSSAPGEGLERDTVVAEFLPGYQIHDRVVRPAQVSVAQGSGPLPPAATAVEQAEEDRPAGGDMAN